MLTTINGKTYGFFNRLMPEYTKMEALVKLCENGTAREVLTQIKTSDFDNTLLKRPFFIREASPMPVHPMTHPFTTACYFKNYSVVSLLLELGMDVNVEWNYSNRETHRQHFAYDAKLTEMFEGGKCWWKIEYPEMKKQELQSELERHIQNGNASEAVWLTMHGVRLPSPNALAIESFKKLSPSFKELVCRMGISENHLTDFLSQLKANGLDADVQNVLNSMIHGGQDERNDIVERLLLSIDLLGEEKLDELVSRPFTFSARIVLLKGLIESYDFCEHKNFIERCIARLFREILCDCWKI